jgi:head-tail adaptor
MSNIGQKRERIRIVRQAKTRRADGGYNLAPTTVAEFWAHVDPVSANETEQAGRKRGAVTYLITANRLEGFTTEDGLVWLTNGSLALNIREIRAPGKRVSHMIIVAESGVTQ